MYSGFFIASHRATVPEQLLLHYKGKVGVLVSYSGVVKVLSCFHETGSTCI